MQKISLSDLVVVVVEPSLTQRRIICRALQTAGIDTLIEVANGQAALDALANESPDLIVSSLYLPDMTGTELVHRIRGSAVAGDTPFMLVSSETRFRYLDPIRQAGVVGILPKPFSQDELQTALTTTLDLIDGDERRLDGAEPESVRVLVVDDSALARRHITRVLNSLGIEHIDHAADGVEALAMIEDRYYDFVVTDYNMPRMDGRELIDHIRQGGAHASLPILMVTSEANENRLAAVQRSGVSAICDKPFEPAAVRSLVRQMITG